MATGPGRPRSGPERRPPLLRLTYSNRFEELAAALCEDLAAERARTRYGLFEASRILVPNHHVTAYLKLALARHLGVAAGLEFQFLSSFIADCVPASRPDLKILDAPRLLPLLLGVLSDDDLLAEPDLAPVRDYLLGAGDDDDAVELRRIQLADKLATLFSDYRLSRPEMLRRWPDGLALEDRGGAAASEVWQRRLWLALFEPTRGVVAELEQRTGVRWCFGPDLFNEVLVKDMSLPRRIYMLGFSYLPWAHHRVLALLARYRDVLVYTLNPCMEFWEDLRAGWETRLAGRQLRSRGDDAVQLSFEDLEDTPALRLWGRPGRENVRILGELTQCDFEARFVDPSEHATDPGQLSMLAAVQRDVLFRQPARTEPDPDIRAGDDTIQILGCPSVQRELEIIGNEIWRLMGADPELRFNDIALLVGRTDQETYQAHIPAVFGELHHIPYHFADLPLPAESRIVEALLMLLDLPYGRFTRPELLRLLTHPAVLARYPDVDPNDWVHWSERLGIVHGGDHTDHADTYIEQDLFNWEQGIRRLALGAFMAGERSGETRPLRVGDSAYLPEELPADLLPSAARFALLARSLIADARHCRQARKSLTQWRIFFDLLVSTYLAARTPEDERHLGACREVIAQLAATDIDHRPVRYRVACEIVRAQLMSLRGESAELFAHGVTVAPLLPMRPIPFRMVFLAGMGEGHFPAAERESPLDLRVARRRRGDVSPRERDRYLFLETLLSTRERIYLSYVSRDDQTGETLQPSPVVLELAHLLRRGYARGDSAERLTVDHPLRRYDPRYFPALFTPGADAADDDPGPAEAPLISVAPSAHRQAHVLALRRHLEDMLRTRGRDLPSMADLERALQHQRFATLRRHLGLADFDADGDGDHDEASVSISLAMIRRFLESPLQAWAAAVLRLRDSELEDLVTRADEAFSTPTAPMVGLLREVFGAHLGAEDRSFEALVDRYHRRAHHIELSGQGPTGVFSDIDRERHLAILHQWYQHLSELTDEVERFATISFGRAREHSDVGALLEPIALTFELPGSDGRPRPVRVELFGRTDPLGVPAVGSLVLTHRPRDAPKHIIRGFIDHIALAAAGHAVDRDHCVTIVTAGAHRAQHYLGGCSQDQARAYLSLLVAEMLGSQHEYLLPCEAVFRWRAKPGSSLIGHIETLRRDGRGFSCAYGPVTQIDRLPVPDRAEAMVEQRFGPLFDRLAPFESPARAAPPTGSEASARSKPAPPLSERSRPDRRSPDRSPPGRPAPDPRR
ncbi:exodeoxyribonuclease V subunit gamma [Haliangium sp.]|uniref:exodeoxyribonuclease V subunit gamma n=1 Tax=Haliangium sp. TaxID=2663208 RepID=UPI003D0A1EAA